MSLRRISKARFDALTYARHPYHFLVAEEAEWFSDPDEHVLGVLLRDRTDNDWNYVLVGRDERGLFRYIQGDGSIESRTDARNALLKALQEQSATGQYEFPQGDVRHKKNEIYRVAVPESRLNPHFLTLAREERYSPAKEIIQEIAYALANVDGNFIEDFQSQGFNARLWELYLLAYLHEDLFTVERPKPSPDFKATNPLVTVFVEAVTVNPSPGFDIKRPPQTPEELTELVNNYAPIKYGSPLYSKLGKEYWKQDHVAGQPLVFAIHDFHAGDSMCWSYPAVGQYLYGLRWKHIFDAHGNLVVVPEKVDVHRFGSKEIPSGFFSLPDSRHVSAVLYSNSATLPKFNRMGKLAGFGSPRVCMRRVGICYDHTPNAAAPKEFSVDITPDSYAETWGQGTEMYHNPNALHPIPPEAFPGIAHHFLENDLMRSILPAFSPYSSKTLIWLSKEDPPPPTTVNL
ncbi:hypothetical protein ACFLSJ_08630 [Verrucomicrobiota bacterium]